MPRISLCISESVCFRQSGTVPGSSRSELLCEFHWRPYSKSFLKTFVIVKMDVLVDGRMQLAAAIELIQGIHLCLHNSPEPFHWAILAIKNPPKAVWLFTLSALGGSYHIWRVCLFCCGIRRKRVEGTEVIIGDLHGAFFAAPCPLHL